MKKEKKSTIFLKPLFNFLITVVTAFFTIDNQNIIYSFLDKFLWNNKTFKHVVISALIILLGKFFWSFINSLWKKIIIIFKLIFGPININVSYKKQKNTVKTIKFEPNGSEYEDQKLSIVLKIIPSGKLPIYLLKRLHVKLNIFFNPKIIDVSLENDKKWMNEDYDIQIDDKQNLCIEFLKNYTLHGKSNAPFNRTDEILIIPKFMKTQTTNVNVCISILHFNFLCPILTKLKSKNLLVECKEQIDD